MNSINCDSCLAKLKYPDRLAGKKLRCPKCQSIVALPDLEFDPDEFAASILDEGAKPATADEPILDAKVPTKDCPFCGEEIKKHASKCRFCGEYLRASLRQEVPEREFEPETLRRRISPVVGCGCLLPLLFAVVMIIAVATDNPRRHHRGNNHRIDVFSSEVTSNLMAVRMAEKFVRDRLKAPSTAKFPSATESIRHVQHAGGNTYEVNSFVDAQNSFGAAIRTRYYCKLQDKGSGRWTCVELKLIER